MFLSRQLHHFHAIAETGSMLAAADKIGVSQPALSRSIKQLEESLSVTLFERLPRGMTLTPEGEILAQRVKLMQIEYRHALSEIDNYNLGTSGQLRIAAGPVWISSLLPPVIARFATLYPKVRSLVVQGGFNTQINQLLSGEQDAVFGSFDFPVSAELVQERLVTLRHTVVARADHPLTSDRIISPRELAQYKWVVPANDSISTSRIAAYYLAHDLGLPEIAVETSTLGALALVRSSDFLTTFSTSGLPLLNDLGICPVNQSGNFWEFPAGIVTRRSPRQSPALNAFVRLARTMLKD